MEQDITQDLKFFTGRKKTFAVLPYQARLIISFMSDGVVRKESEIMDKIRADWGRDSLDRGRITHFCRCAKDENRKHLFAVTGNRPRDIQFIPRRLR
tara:strand:- start:10734 stop:11024 length:291 start_codon:yes stop_codon:yes gene_type:complete